MSPRGLQRVLVVSSLASTPLKDTHQCKIWVDDSCLKVQGNYYFSVKLMCWECLSEERNKIFINIVFMLVAQWLEGLTGHQKVTDLIPI